MSCHISLGIVAEKKAKAKPLAETNHELAQLLHGRRRKSGDETIVESADLKRKMSRMNAIRAMLSEENPENLKAALEEDARVSEFYFIMDNFTGTGLVFVLIYNFNY